MQAWLRRKDIDRVTVHEEGRRLVPTLGWPHLVALGIGAIVGTGIYTLIGVGANLAGPAVLRRRCILDGLLEVRRNRAHAATSAARFPARLPKTQHSRREFPIIRLRPCVPPAISPQAKSPSTVVSPCSSITSPPFW